MKRLVAALLTTAGFAAYVLAGPAQAQEKSFTVMSWGGAYQDAQRKAWFEPFVAQRKLKLAEEEYSGELAKIKAMVDAGNVKIDVINVDAKTAMQGCDGGILERLDYAKITDRSKFLPNAALDCAVASDIYSTIYAYDTTKFKGEVPKTIADFFDTKKFPGKRGVQKVPFSTLEFALLADGVPVADVYKVMKTEAGIDRAFKKLDTIKKDAVWWTAGAQPPQLLASGEVVMTTGWNGRIQAAIDKDKKPFKIVWDGQMLDYDLFVIPKGAPNQALSYEFLRFQTEPKVMAALGPYIPYAPTRIDATDFVDPAVLPKLPTDPQNMKNAFYADYLYWNDRDEELQKRFEAWLAK